MSTNSVLTNEKPTIEHLLQTAYTIRVSDLQKSISLSKNALYLSRELNDHALIGRSLNMLSLFYMIMGNYPKAIRAANEAIKCFELLNDERGIADAKYNLAGVHYKTDNYHLGIIYLIDCLGVYKKYNDYHNQARAQKSLGTIYEYIGDIRNAKKAYDLCISAAKRVNDVNMVSNAYNPLSGLYLKEDKVDKASELIDEAIRMKTESGDVRGLAFSMYGRAKVFIKIKEYDKAERDLDFALDIHTRESERLGKAMALHRKALLYFEMGNIEGSLVAIKEALGFSDEFNIVIIKFKSYHLLYRIYKRQNNMQDALHYLELYISQKEAVINTQTLKVIENYELITGVKTIEAGAKAEREKAEIIEKKELAEKTAKMKQEFLSAMSHEIRTPLNAVINITSMLSERQEPGEKELFDTLKFASNNLLMIINDILDFNKLDAGKAELEMRPCNIRQLLGHLTHTYEHLALNKGLRIGLTIDNELFNSYEADETKLSQILGNLISNAIKYTESGQVAIGVQHVSGDDASDVLRFIVTDTGVGIPEEHYEKLFDSFSQPRTITTRKESGSGLGLAIVKKLVELYNSEILFNSVINEGSTFSFDLLLKKSVQHHAPIAPIAEKAMYKNVLLAEDNMINALVARKLLAKWDIVADHAKDGQEAVTMAEGKQYDIILMDIHMPGMNGFQATQKIRNTDNLNNTTPIYALTADVTAKDQTDYVNYFTGFLSKPIEIDKLQKALTSDILV